jgi:hypothetical protein
MQRTSKILTPIFLASLPLFASLRAHAQICHGSCGNENPAPPSSEYRGEANWKNGVRLPKLLSEKMYTPEQICADAKATIAAKGEKKKFALVLYTTHFCDGSHRHCMGETRTVSDPCNKFLQNNFELYQVQTWIYAKPVPKGDEMTNLYSGPDGAGPAYAVIDLESCKITGKPFLPSSEYDAKSGYRSWLDGSPQKRFQMLKSDLLKLESVRQKLDPAQRALEGRDLDCSAEERKRYPVLGTEAIDVGGQKELKIDLLRSLLNEQYEEVHGPGSLKEQQNKKADD